MSVSPNIRDDKTGSRVGRKDITMDSHRREAREFLMRTDRPTFLEVVYRAKVTPRQKEILYKRFLDGESNTEIAMGMHLSEEAILRDLGKAYDLLFNYLFVKE